MTTSNFQQRVAFVTGGSGFVGGRLIRALAANGWQVRALARNDNAERSVMALGAQPVRGDMTSEVDLQNGLGGSDVVFHVAAMFKLWGKRKDFDAVNVEGMKRLVAAAKASASVRKIVYVSAAAVIMGDPRPILRADETVPTRQRAFAPYSSSKAEAEQILLAANAPQSGFETIAIRPPLIWGKGMPMLDQMAETVRKGQWQWVGGGSQAMSTCHVDNLVAALLLAAEGGQGGQAYFVADAEERTLKSIMSDLLATQGVKAKDKSVSFNTAWRLAGIMAFVWRLLALKGEPPLTRQLLQLIGKPFTIRTEKAQRDLGYSPIVSWRSGLDEMSAANRPLHSENPL